MWQIKPRNTSPLPFSLFLPMILLSARTDFASQPTPTPPKFQQFHSSTAEPSGAGRHCLTFPLSWLPFFQAGSCRPSQGHTLQSVRIKEYPSPQMELLIVTHLSNCKFQALHSQSSPSLNVSSHHYNPLSLLKAQHFNLAILKTILAGTSKEKEPIRNKQLEVRVFPCSAHKIKRWDSFPLWFFCANFNCFSDIYRM